MLRPKRRKLISEPVEKTELYASGGTRAAVVTMGTKEIWIKSGKEVGMFYWKYGHPGRK